MIPVDQKYIQKASLPLGDCLAACVASIFEMPLDEVPHFVDRMYRCEARRPQPADWDWFSMVNQWAADFGVAANFSQYAPRKKPKHWHPGFWIASVNSRVTADGSHAVVVNSGKVVHDPNPESREAKGPYLFKGEYWFEVFEPAILMRSVDWRVILEKTQLAP